MMVTCKEILNLPELSKVKVVGGKGGLNRIISWVHIVEVPNVGEWSSAGDLVFLTGVGLKSYKEDLLDIIRQASEKNLSGIVVGVGPYINKIPKEAIEISDILNVPLFEVPFEVKITFITQSIIKMIFNNQVKLKSMNDLMEEVIFGTYKEDMIDRATFYGYKTKEEYAAIVVDIDKFSEFIKKENIKDEYIILKIKTNIQNIISSIFRKYDKNILYVSKSDSFNIMVPVKTMEEILKIAEEIKLEIKNKVKGITVSIGIGSMCQELRKFKNSVYEANKALTILKACNREDTIRSYSELGIYRLFFKVEDIDELNRIYMENLGKLVEYDDKNGTDLLDTLEIYLNEDRNLRKTSEELYIHRNTLKYRVSRIEEILDRSLEGVNECFNLRLAFKIRRFINMLK